MITKHDVQKALAQSIDDSLLAMGLQRRRGIIEEVATPIACFFAGAAIGTGLALLLAPSAGSDLRSDLRGKLRDIGEKAKDTVKRNGAPVRSGIHSTSRIS
jgi:hypothetical protein